MPANYPSLPQWEGSDPTIRSGVMERIASNGAVRPRALASAAKMDYQFVHGMLTDAQWATFKQFYIDNRVVSFFITPQGETPRLVYFAADNPYQFKKATSGLHSVVVNFREA